MTGATAPHCLLGETSASTAGAQSTAGPLKIKRLSGKSVRANGVCLWLGILSNVAGSLIYQRRRLQQCHIHWERQLAPGRDRSGRRALEKLEAPQRSTQESCILARNHEEKGISMGGSEVTPSRSPQQRTTDTLQGRNCRRDRNIGRGREVSLLGHGEGWLSMGIRKCHQHTVLKLHSKGPPSLGCRFLPCHVGRIQTPPGHHLVSCIVAHLREQPPRPAITSHRPGDGPHGRGHQGLQASRRRAGRTVMPGQALRGQRGDPWGGGRAAAVSLGKEQTRRSRRGSQPSWHQGSHRHLQGAPEEVGISPSPGQGPRQVEAELRQHPRNARPPAAMPTVVPRRVSRRG